MGEEQKTHVHVLEDGTVVEQPSFKGHWSYGVYQTHDRGRKGLQ